jgi:uncharacterized membrane protein YdfJ with MMPL/SSD domain
MSPDSASPRGDGVLGRVGRRCYRHRRLVLLTWIVGAVILIGLGTKFGAAADDTFTGNDPGQTLLNQHFHRQSGDALTLAIASDSPVRSPAVKAQVASAIAVMSRATGVTSVSSPYQVPGQISADGHIAFATVQFSLPMASIKNSEALALMADARRVSGHGTTFSLGGDVIDNAETPSGGPTEGFGVLAAAIVLLIAFGSLLAMGLPIVTAIFGIGAGLSIIALLGHLVPAPSFSPIVASLIGIGVGVDYALFIVTRFREALRGTDGHQYPGQPARAPQSPEEAVVTAMRTAGRSVLTAGTTVAIGMLGLLVLRQAFLNGVAVAAAVTVAIMVAGSLTLVPALLGFSGTRLAKPSRIRLRGRRTAGPGAERSKNSPAASPAAARWAAMIQRRPVIALVGSLVVIAALAAPALGMKLSFPDESAQVHSTMGYQSYATMARGFGPGFDAPLIVAAELPAGGASAGMAKLASAVRATAGVARVTPVAVSGDHQAAMFIAYPTTGEQDAATNTLVNHMTGTVLPQATAGTGITSYVTGPNAGNVTFANLISARLPLLVAVVVVLSMLLLLVTFRSVTVTIKAALMNLLSISAAYGVLTLVTQDGFARQLFGFPEKLPVTTWVPVFLFVILFGLSMDYEVFLLSRIREAYDATGDNSGSVSAGVASTARVISAAAAIMIVVFLSSVLGGNVSVKQVGLGLAVAVLIDATIVRLVLVPAVMELLGRANWWLPGWLDRILPETSRHGDEPPAPVAREAVSAVE